MVKLLWALCLLVVADSVVGEHEEVRVAEAGNPKWVVLEKLFSAITIGIGFKDDKTGWTSHTDGSTIPRIVKTTDAGVTWEPVKNTTGKPN